MSSMFSISIDKQKYSIHTKFAYLYRSIYLSLYICPLLTHTLSLSLYLYMLYTISLTATTTTKIFFLRKLLIHTIQVVLFIV